MNIKYMTSCNGDYKTIDNYKCSDIGDPNCDNLDSARYSANICIAVVVLLLLWKGIQTFMAYNANRARILKLTLLMSMAADIVAGCAGFAACGYFRDWADNDLDLGGSIEFGYGWGLFLTASFLSWFMAVYSGVVLLKVTIQNAEKGSSA